MTHDHPEARLESAPGQPPLRRMSSRLRHASHRESGKPEFETEAIAQGQVPSRRLLRVGRSPAPADVADWLGVAAGELVMIRQRLQFLNGAPSVISAPARMPGKLSPSSVAVDAAELRSTCRHSTRRSLTPLARAVRT